MWTLESGKSGKSGGVWECSGVREVFFVLFLLCGFLRKQNKIGQRLFVVNLVVVSKKRRKSNCSQPQTQRAFFAAYFVGWVGKGDRYCG